MCPLTELLAVADTLLSMGPGTQPPPPHRSHSNSLSFYFPHLCTLVSVKDVNNTCTGITIVIYSGNRVALRYLLITVARGCLHWIRKCYVNTVTVDKRYETLKQNILQVS